MSCDSITNTTKDSVKNIILFLTVQKIFPTVLANSKIPLRVKKWVVSQKGDFPGTLASLAISLVKAFAEMKCSKKMALVPED